MEPFGGLIETPNIERIAERGLTVHELPHDGAVLADPLVPDDRPQPHHERDGCITEAASGFPNANGHIPFECATIAEVLGERGWNTYMVGQVASLRRGRDEPGVDQAPVADRSRVRALLRVPRRRDEPVVSGPGLRQPPGRAADVARGGLPLHDRHHRQGARVHPGRQGDRPRQAVLPVLLPGRGHAPHHAPEGVDRQVRAASSTWATRRTGRSCSSARRRWASSPTRPSCRRSIRTRPRRAPTASPGPSSTRCGRGTRCRPTSSGCSRAWPRCTPASSATPTTSSVGCSTTSRRPASSTTPSSCSCPTTARRARAGRTAR